jgi:hypothetical protein
MTKHEETNARVYLMKFLQSVWFFPAILTLGLILLTALRISGTSIGVYDTTFYGDAGKTQHIVAGHTEPVRSDEWLVSTQLTIAQHAAGYPVNNPNITGGHDMSVIGDAPYKEWSAIFKPQNLSFLVLPLDFAFALKWWLILYLTIISCYFFILRLFTKRVIFAALFSSAVGCTPFLFWWYQTGSLAPIFYGFFLMTISMRIINKEPVTGLAKYRLRYSMGVYAIILAYLLTCFALIFYPPFQIPIATVVAAFVLGYFLTKNGATWQKLRSRSSVTTLATLAVGILLSSAIVVTFISTRSTTISAIEHTAYPGARVMLPGNEPPSVMMASYLQLELEHTKNAFQYYMNPSEASDFFPFMPLLVIPGFVVLWLDYKRSRKINWPLLAIQACACLFMAELFVPTLHTLYRLVLFDKVGISRLRIGMGFLGLLQLLLIIRSKALADLPKKTITTAAAIYSLQCLTLLLWAGQVTALKYPLFISTLSTIFWPAILFSVIIFSFLSRRLVLGALLFFLLSFGSVFRIHPLYRSLEPLYPNQLTNAIDQVSKPGSTWVSVDDLMLENIPALANRVSLSGVQPYPNIAKWRAFDGQKDNTLYNRYAHVIFTTDPTYTKRLTLPQPDLLYVRFSCEPTITTHIQYVLASHQLDMACLTPISKVTYPNHTYFIYSIKP